MQHTVTSVLEDSRYFYSKAGVPNPSPWSFVPKALGADCRPLPFFVDASPPPLPAPPPAAAAAALARAAPFLPGQWPPWERPREERQRAQQKALSASLKWGGGFGCFRKPQPPAHRSPPPAPRNGHW